MVLRLTPTPVRVTLCRRAQSWKPHFESTVLNVTVSNHDDGIGDDDDDVEDARDDEDDEDKDEDTWCHLYEWTTNDATRRRDGYW